jgi:hypothetical protein
MVDEISAVGPVRLARSRWRLLALPAMLAIGAVVIGASGIVVGGPLGIGLAAGAGVVLLLALAGAVVLLSVRLDVDVAALELRWLGGSRRYELVPGALTRTALRGRNASTLRAGLSAFGWALGPAMLRDEEEIEVVRLAPTRSAIIVPTDRGRLAVCPVSEDELVSQLTAAVRVKARLDQVASGLGWSHSAAPSGTAEEAAPADMEPEPQAAAPAVEPHLLTGIERMLLEQRLEEERAALAAALEAEQAAAAEAELVPRVEPTPTPTPLPPPRVTPLRRPRTRATWTRPRWMPAVPRPGRRFVAFLSPLAAAGGIWLLARTSGAAAGSSDAVRLLLLAILLGGPAATLAALASQVWWPRLAGLVLATGLAALILVGRVLAT